MNRQKLIEKRKTFHVETPTKISRSFKQGQRSSGVAYIPQRDKYKGLNKTEVRGGYNQSSVLKKT